MLLSISVVVGAGAVIGVVSGLPLTPAVQRRRSRRLRASSRLECGLRLLDGELPA